MRAILTAKAVYLAYSFVSSLLFALCFTAFTLYRVQIVGLSPFELVLVGTVLELTCFVFEVPTGVLADTRSRRLSVMCGTLLLGLGFTLEGLFPILAAVLVAQVVSGIGYTFLSGALEAWIADESGEPDLGPLFMRATQYGQVGGLLGIALSALVGSLNLQLPMFLGGVGFLLLTVFLLLAMPEKHFHPLPTGDRSSWNAMGDTLKSGLQRVRQSLFLKVLMGVALFWGASSEAYDRLSGAHLLELGFPQSILGLEGLTPVLWLSALSVLEMVLGFATTQLLSRFNLEQQVWRRVWPLSWPNFATSRVWPLLWATLGLVAGMLTFALSSSFILALVGFQVMGLMRLIHGPLSSAFIQHGLESRTRATVLSLHSQFDALGQMLGGPLLGLLAARASLSVALLVGALLLLPALGLYLHPALRLGTLEGELEGGEAALELG